MVMVAASAAASTAATAIYKYTYTLGRSLYVPITSRCNSIPLPATRGPGFLLPTSVADALIRVRDAEAATPDRYQDYWAKNGDDNKDRVGLPPYDMPLVNCMYDFGSSSDLPGHLKQQRERLTKKGASAEKENGNINGLNIIDDMLQPSIPSLVEEVSTRLNNESNNFDQVVIAGEGEPTLRMDALLAVARSVKSFSKDSNKNVRSEQSASKNLSSNASNLPIRLITNGLCYGIPNLGYSPQNVDRDGTILPIHRHVVLRDMMEAGISKLSVALNTANRHEYDVLMEPCCYTGGGMIGAVEDVIQGQEEQRPQYGQYDGQEDQNGNGKNEAALMPGTAHDLICEFILEAGKLGMDVEVTGIDRPEIDKEETMRLARLLLSVGPKYKRKKMMRWRRYFYE